MSAIKKTFLLILFCSGFHAVHAQHTFIAVTRDSITHETLTGVSAVVEGTLNGSNSDINGKIEIKNIPDGRVNILFSLIGYKKTARSFQFPFVPEKPVEIFLAAENVSLQEITISTTRTNSRIEDRPEKLEVIGPEDMDEESTIMPGNISSLLGDIAGLQLQQTSAVTGNSNIRIQGLDGKYTQVLRDGLPLYEGFSGGFGILDIPPLDLKQIEIIKGSASTLFGGGAIAGLINLISKEPTDSAQLTVALNQTSLQQTNVNAFYSNRNSKTGITLTGGGTYQNAVDVDGDGFSDQPQNRSVFIHPKLFFYFNPYKKLTLGYSGMMEEKLGGDIRAIHSTSDSLHSYFEKNKINRNTIDFNYSGENKKHDVLTCKGVASIYNRTASTNTDEFNAHEWVLFSELSYLKKFAKHNLVSGISFNSNLFYPDNLSATIGLNSIRQFTEGVFVQDDWKINEHLTVEAGFRFDHHNTYGNFLLPRLSLVTKWNKHFTSRIGSGYGYKIPELFADDIFEKYSSPVLHPDAEKSLGINGDLNYSTIIGKLSLVVNQSFFYTRINQPVITQTDSNFVMQFVNSNDHIITSGSESYIRMNYEEIDVYLGYVYSLPRLYSDGVTSDLILTPHHKFASTCLVELEHGWKAGIETSYIGEQDLDLGRKSQGYWLGATMLQKKISSLTMTLNCENIFDFRQTKKERVVLPPLTSPTFKSIWAPLDGRVFNLSLKWMI